MIGQPKFDVSKSEMGITLIISVICLINADYQALGTNQ